LWRQETPELISFFDDMWLSDGYGEASSKSLAKTLAEESRSTHLGTPLAHGDATIA
jgi:hypothetical protein